MQSRPTHEVERVGPQRRGGRRWILIVAGLALVAALVLVARPRTDATPTLPDLTLARVAGGDLDLATLEGRPVVLNLWATWCGPCRRELPRMAELAATYPEVAFVFAAQREDEAKVARFLNDHGFELELVVLDDRGQLADRFRSPGLPTTLFFDADRQLMQAHLGEISTVQLFNATVSLLDNDSAAP
jgi:thiol-disulfide isomerase/thioredoxin